MRLPLAFRRWRALRDVPPLDARSLEGSVVQATGIARAGDEAHPFVPPIANVPCVVAWMAHGPPPGFARWHLEPFLLDLGDRQIVVDAHRATLLFPVRREGNSVEISVAVGARITVVGELLRDGADMAAAVSFREAEPSDTLVGTKQRPIIIASP